MIIKILSHHKVAQFRIYIKAFQDYWIGFNLHTLVKIT